MVEYVRTTWNELGRSIFVGERYERNVRGIALVALFLVVVNVATGSLNLMNGYYSAVVTSAIFILSGLVILYFTLLRRNRSAAVATGFVAFVAVFTYSAFSVAHGFPIFWTLLLPLGCCYLVGVREGIYLSLYFLVLYSILFYTPLRYVATAQYTDVIAQRFPILYLANAILTTFIMVQYHLATLHQMDYAQQLLEAKEAADQANAAKSDFLASMSHEIRTPIHAVLGMNEMVLRESARARRLDDGDTHGVQEALDNIRSYACDVRDAGNGLLSIVNTILDFSKLEEGKMDLVEAPYSLGSLVSDAYHLLFLRAQEKGLRMGMDVDATLPDGLYGDYVRVRQVLTNLLSNAVKYTEQGEVWLGVRGNREAGCVASQTIELVFEVRDTGIGIRSEDLQQLFGKFQRVDLERNGTVEGTGLGLAITQGLLSMMGGSIAVESSYGTGSTFTVTLPQRIVSSDPVGDRLLLPGQGAATTGEYDVELKAPDARVLVVDDTEMNLNVVTALLKATEVQVDTATSGAQAIGLARENIYDLVLMDQRMPEMSGTEAMRRIRSQEDGPNRSTPIVCLTADAVRGARERYLAEGFTDFLTKPVDGHQLERMLVLYLPDEKASFVAKQDDRGDADKGEAPVHVGTSFAPLAAVGIDPAVGLGFCQGDESLYLSLLDDYARGAQERLDELSRYGQAGDGKNLAIVAHAIKSTSQMIGATTLSELSVQVERAADEGRVQEVAGDLERMRELYEKTVAAIRQVVPASAEPTPEDEEILEFFPD